MKPNDLVFATDSSSKNDLTGISVYCVNDNKQIEIDQPVGAVSNNYGELYAIYNCKWYIENHNIDTNNRRIIIFTDSLNNYLPLITTPIKYKNKLEFPELYEKTQQFLIDYKVILWKIKSHTNPEQWFNHKADRLADKGRMNPLNNHHLLLSDNEQYGLNVKTKIDPITNNLLLHLARQCSLRASLEPRTHPPHGREGSLRLG